MYQRQHATRNPSKAPARILTAGLIIALLLTTLIPPLAANVAPWVSSLPLASVANAAGTYTGIVYNDYNANGVQDSQEIGLIGVTVNLYDSDNVLQGTGTTAKCTGVGTPVAACASASDAYYSIAAGGTGPYRVEYVLPGDPANSTGGELADSYWPGVAGSTEVVQTVADGGATLSAVSFNNPVNYCQSDPEVINTIHSWQGPADGFGGNFALIGNAFSYRANNAFLDAEQDAIYARHEDIGATYGLAYNRTDDEIYAGAFMRFLSGFGDGTGTATGQTDGSTGAIYKVDRATNTVSVLLDLPASETGANPHPNSTTNWFCDPAINEVGKIGWGDLEMAEDDSVLYAMNLFNRALYQINPTTGAVLSTHPVPGATGGPAWSETTCNGTGDVARPFALEVKDGLVYVGLTCENNSIADSSGISSDYLYVFTFDPAASSYSSTPVLDFALNASFTGPGGFTLAGNPAWDTWTEDPVTDNNPINGVDYQPWLTDLEFDGEDLLLGIRNRSMDYKAALDGAQYGDPSTNTCSGVGVPRANAGGAVLRACFDGSGLVLESGGSCGGVQGYGDLNPTDTDNTEFFYEQEAQHRWDHVGSLVNPAGFSEFGATTIPGGSRGAVAYYDDAAEFTWRTPGGDQYKGQYSSVDGVSTGGFFGKQNGMGDLEALCDPAPIEVGNYVWNDADADGQQGPGESGIANVVVGLYDSGGVLIATATTDADGKYLFTTQSTDWEGFSIDYSGDPSTTLVSLDPNGTYTLAVLDSNFAGGNALDGLGMTAANVEGTTNNPNVDNSDSDHTSVSVGSGGDAAGNGVTFTLNGAGTNNHSFDFGATDAQPVSLGSYVWEDLDGDGTQDAGEPGILGATVTLWVDNGSGVLIPAVDSNGAPVVSQITGSDGLYYFDNLPEGTYEVRVTPPAGYTPTSIQSGDPIDGSTNTNLVADDSNIAGVGALGDGTPYYSSGPVTLTAGSEPTETGGFAGDGQDDAGDTNGNMTVDFGFVQPAAIGNYIWVDEDSNGLQDEGEPGIPNVTVNLYDDTGTLVATTVTDSHGGYLFPYLQAGTYYVDVNETTLPSGMTQTSIYTNVTDADSDGLADDGDFGNKDRSSTTIPSTALTGYAVSVVSGEENLTADFGYNYNPTADVNNPTGSPTAALGDRVWIDTDGDGVQDPSEIGVSGVEVTLTSAGPDGLFGTADDVTEGTATTDENGYYLFDGLTPGAYVVTVTDSSTASHAIPTAADGQVANGYTQTGDPDHFAVTDASSGNNDGLSTTPVVLGPGDVFLNVDFGYQPTGATLGSIGDTVWLDANAGGTSTQDAGEPGIPGVTVALIQDSNGNGVWDAGEAIIATDTTDANGKYLFQGLPLDDGDGDADYIVWVNDTDNVLDGLSQTYDQDAPLDNFSAAALSGGSPQDLNQDFSYAPIGHSGGSAPQLGNGEAELGETGDVTFPGIAQYPTQLTIDGEVIDPAYCAQAGVSAPGLAQDYTVIDPATLTDSDFNNPNYTVAEIIAYVEAALAAEDDTVLNADKFEINDAIHFFTDDNNVSGKALTIVNRVLDGTYQPQPALWFEVVPGPLGGAYQILVARDPSPSLSADGLIGDTVWFDTNASGGDQTTQGDEPGIEGVVMELYSVESTTALVYADQFDGGADYSNSTQPPGTEDWSATPWIETGDDGAAGSGTISINTTTQELRLAGSGGTQYVERTIGDLSGETSAVWTFDWRKSDSWEVDDEIYFEVWNGTSWVTVTTLTGDVIESTGSDSVSIDLFSVLGTTERSDVKIRYGINANRAIEEFYIDNVAVTVGSSATTETLIGTTTTDENGNYLFGGLPLDETYRVKVAAENFDPGGVLEGMDETYAAGATVGGNQGNTVTLTPADPVNLDQDFSYTGDDAANGSIGNRVWLDQNADGDWDGVNGPDGIAATDDDEPGIEGVTIDLYRDLNGNGVVDPGEPLIGTTTTDANGNYLFDNLPIVGAGATGGAAYVVDVTDEAGVLNGYWHSLGSQDAYAGDPTADEQDQSKADPFAVEIGGTQPTDNLNVDFGYYVEPAAVGNYVWVDTNANGLQDDGETGLNGVDVQLEITYPDGTVTTLTTRTVNDSSGNPGYYSFGNLLLDEDYNGDGSGPEPTFTISVDPNQSALDGYSPTLTDVNSNGNDREDSDDFAGVAAQPIQGLIDTTAQDPATNEPAIAAYDFGLAASQPILAISKVLNTPEPVRIGDTLSFTIRITNTGPTTIAVLPLVDDYDRDYISYVDATPASDDNTNDGTVNWTDLTISFSSDLAPGAFFDVVVRFTALRDTGLSGPTVNTASVTGAEDVNGNTPDPVDDSDDVAVLAPTAVYLSSRSATRSDAGITLAWSTADETQIAAFRVVRTNSDGSEVLLTSDAIPAQFAGQPTGASYRLVDSDLRGQSTVRYDLELIAPDGSVSRLDLGRVNAGYGVYLPLVTR